MSLSQFYILVLYSQFYFLFRRSRHSFCWFLWRMNSLLWKYMIVICPLLRLSFFINRFHIQTLHTIFTRTTSLVISFVYKLFQSFGKIFYFKSHQITRKNFRISYGQCYNLFPMFCNRYIRNVRYSKFILPKMFFFWKVHWFK